MSDRSAPQIVVLGGINSDFVVRGPMLPRPGQTVEGDTFYSGPGGKGANQAVAAARLGAKVVLIGCVGDEARGKELLTGLRKEGLDLKHVRRIPTVSSGAAIIAVDDSGEKQIAAALGANLKVTRQQVTTAESVIKQSKVLLVQFETPMPVVLQAARLAKKHGVKVVLDPAPPREIPKALYPLLEVIRPNSDEAEQITGVKVRNKQTARKAARRLLECGVKVVAMESGDGGDLVISEDEEWFFPRLKVKSVDATGAGDAFAGAFATGLAEGLPLQDVGRLANATAALATTRVGAQEALPTRAEVERLLKKSGS